MLESSIAIHRLPLSLVCLFAFGAPLTLSGNESIENDGETLYRQKCATCHGGQGQGTDNYQAHLEGDLSIAELATVIQETMPEDNPQSLSDEEAQSVAEFVYHAFYSDVAVERNRPARIELARLTARQYRMAVADLVGSFRDPLPVATERGLNGEYYLGRKLGNRQALALSRVDSRVAFDFGVEAPAPEVTDAAEYSIRWHGSLTAPDTGNYEFVVRTEHAARLWINGREPLIDAWVKSGSETEYRADLFLVGGRAYPLRLEFTKAKQGVDDSAKRKTKPPSKPASIALLWRRPGRVLNPVPQRHLQIDSAPLSFVCRTSFPPDDRSYGWVRGAGISQAWDRATTEAAIETASYILQHLAELAGRRDPNRDVLQQFCESFVERAFRRPLTSELRQQFIDKQFESAPDAESAVQRIVLLTLKSPRFLFREIGGLPEYDVASRMAFGLWDSTPDKSLREAAGSGELGTREQLAEQAQRMVTDPRAKFKLKEFLWTWTRSDLPTDLRKNQDVYPDFDEQRQSDLRTSLELFFEDILDSPAADFRQLLLSEEVFANQPLREFYGAAETAVDEFTKIRLDEGQRAGVLTHPYLMAQFAHASESSPIHRGVFLARGLLGHSLRPPPEAVTPLAPELHPELTTRQRVAKQTQDETCMTCHRIINPLGFALEHFDAVGRYRDVDRGKPVDASSTYRASSGTEVAVDGARDLAAYLAGSDEAQAAFTEQLFHHLVKQPINAYGAETKRQLRESFAASDFNIRELAVEIMVVSSPVGREAPPREPGN